MRPARHDGRVHGTGTAGRGPAPWRADTRCPVARAVLWAFGARAVSSESGLRLSLRGDATSQFRAHTGGGGVAARAAVTGAHALLATSACGATTNRSCDIGAAR